MRPALLTTIDTKCVYAHELFTSLQAAGFEEPEAMYLVLNILSDLLTEEMA